MTDSGQIYYFKAETDDAPRGTIEVADITSVAEGKEEETAFVVRTPSRDWHMRADSVEGKAQWIKLITQQMGGGADGGGGAGATESGVGGSGGAAAAAAAPAADLDLQRWQLWNAAEVGQWLSQIGFAQHAAAFVAKSVHGSLLESISADDLQKLGVVVEEERWKLLSHVQQLVVANLQFGTPMPTGGALG
eukprot:g5289.t1